MIASPLPPSPFLSCSTPSRVTLWPCDEAAPIADVRFSVDYNFIADLGWNFSANCMLFFQLHLQRLQKARKLTRTSNWVLVRTPESGLRGAMLVSIQFGPPSHKYPVFELQTGDFSPLRPAGTFERYVFGCSKGAFPTSRHVSESHSPVTCLSLCKRTPERLKSFGDERPLGLDSTDSDAIQRR